MALSMMNIGESIVIRKINGKDDTKKFLETLGFVVGSVVTVVAEMSGNLIVNVKGSKVAIGKEMANKIIVG